MNLHSEHARKEREVVAHLWRFAVDDTESSKLKIAQLSTPRKNCVELSCSDISLHDWFGRCIKCCETRGQICRQMIPASNVEKVSQWWNAYMVSVKTSPGIKSIIGCNLTKLNGSKIQKRDWGIDAQCATDFDLDNIANTLSSGAHTGIVAMEVYQVLGKLLHQ